MLTEDLHLGIMPIGGRTKNPQFKVTIEPADSKVEKLIIDGLPTHHGQPYNLSEAVSEFIGEAAQILAYYGNAYYEIVYYYENESAKRPISFTLDNISNYNIHGLFGFFWQLLPKKSMQYAEEKTNRFIWLPRDRIVKLKLPDEIGGPRTQQLLLKDLAWLSKETIPKFAMDDMAKQEQQPGYDFMTYRWNRDVYLGRITKDIGWPVRSLLNDQVSEFYQLYRYLKFEKTKAIIRENILSELNNVLKIAGKKIGFSAEIKIVGMPYPADFDTYIERLSAGKLKFAEIVNIMKV
jgi:hypothetical protein